MEPDNVVEISRAICDLQKMSEEQRLQLGENGYMFVMNNHTYSVLGQKFLDVMININK